MTSASSYLGTRFKSGRQEARTKTFLLHTALASSRLWEIKWETECATGQPTSEKDKGSTTSIGVQHETVLLHSTRRKGLGGRETTSEVLKELRVEDAMAAMPWTYGSCDVVLLAIA